MKQFLSIAANIVVSLGISLIATYYFFAAWEMKLEDWLGVLPANLPLIIALSYMAGFLQESICLFWLGQRNNDAATKKQAGNNLILLAFSCIALFIFIPDLRNLMGLLLGIFALLVLSSLLISYLKIRFDFFDGEKPKNSDNRRLILRRVLFVISSLVFVWGIYVLQVAQRISEQFYR